jgi:asparagine synthase (glutamine-hydrolysing)
MCGIVGLVDLKGREVSIESVKAMSDAIAHRGPDGEGQWVFKNVGIGHRRLAIIDLTEAATQPMISKDGRYVLTYNGEIYNYKEIRKELESLGYIFYSQSDTEVLLASLILWKEKALLKFNGMFAFAFFDKLKGEILLGRDRYGIKPLYYSLQDSYFTFGSEQKAIKARNNFNSSLDKAALLEYMTFQNIFTDKTLDKNIKILEAGHYMFVNTKILSQFNPVQYWDYHFLEPEKPKHEKEYMEELDRLFRQAIKRTLISDVEIGSYLSGGIDSGSITAIASQENPSLKTFTIGFDLSSASGIEMGFDERSKAKVISDKFQTVHHERLLMSGDMERSLEKLVWHIEEPRVGQSYPNMYAAELASKWVKVVLSGAGGDELFGGYPWRYHRVAGSRNFKEYIDGYYLYWQRMIDNKSLKKVFSPIESEVSQVWTRDIFENVFKNHFNELSKPEDYVNHSLYFEAKTFLHGLFVIEDKLSMAYGLETRVPFMDNDLVDFSMGLPVSMKIRKLNENLRIDENNFGRKKDHYYSRTSDGKILLRKTLSRYVEKEVAEREKQGFSSPDSSWFKGDSKNYIKNEILDSSNPIYNVFSFNTIESLINEHITGKRNRRLLIWSLLHLSYYFKQNTINSNQL